jgi:hypothetical protein
MPTVATFVCRISTVGRCLGPRAGCWTHEYGLQGCHNWQLVSAAGCVTGYLTENFLPALRDVRWTVGAGQVYRREGVEARDMRKSSPR